MLHWNCTVLAIAKVHHKITISSDLETFLLCSYNKLVLIIKMCAAYYDNGNIKRHQHLIQHCNSEIRRVYMFIAVRGCP